MHHTEEVGQIQFTNAWNPDIETDLDTFAEGAFYLQVSFSSFSWNVLNVYPKRASFRLLWTQVI